MWESDGCSQERIDKHSRFLSKIVLGLKSFQIRYHIGKLGRICKSAIWLNGNHKGIDWRGITKHLNSCATKNLAIEAVLETHMDLSNTFMHCSQKVFYAIISVKIQPIALWDESLLHGCLDYIFMHEQLPYVEANRSIFKEALMGRMLPKKYHWRYSPFRPWSTNIPSTRNLWSLKAWTPYNAVTLNSKAIYICCSELRCRSNLRYNCISVDKAKICILRDWLKYALFKKAESQVRFACLASIRPLTPVYVRLLWWTSSKQGFFGLECAGCDTTENSVEMVSDLCT